MREANLRPSGAPPSRGRRVRVVPPFLWKGDARRAGGWLPRMIAGASPTVSSRAKPRDLHSRRKNGEYEIAWKRCKPVEPSGKNADVPERFLDFARNDDTGMKTKNRPAKSFAGRFFVPLARERQPDRRSPPCGCPTAGGTAARRSHSPPHTAHHSWPRT